MTTDFLKGANIYLVGMMGSGKSTVGKHLARLLHYRFIDTDEVIVQANGKSINNIFAEQGEAVFREVETQVLAGVTSYTRTVVATGGGMVIKQENWSYLQTGLVVWLNVPVDELVTRLSRDSSRPLLKEGNVHQKLTALLEQRRARYAQADVTVVYKAGGEVGAIAQRALEALQTFVAENPATSTTIER